MDSEAAFNLEEIIDEFKRINLKNNSNLNVKDLKNKIQYIYEEYNKIYTNCQELKDKKGEYNSYLSSIDNDDDYSLIAKMMFYYQDIFGYIPRKIQIISFLYFINKEKSEGLIQQINTGEGKSLIIAFLSVYIALKQKKKVDILTSSPILAQRDAFLFKEFYGRFNLSVSYTSNHNDEIKSKKYFSDSCYKCYKSSIVYGDALSFEGDLLRSSFLGIKGRGEERKFECIIIDEIDNIALDNLKNTTELLDSFHGYKFLEYIYLFIYTTLKKIKETNNSKGIANLIEKKEEIINELYEITLNEFDDFEKLKKKKIFIPKH